MIPKVRYKNKTWDVVNISGNNMKITKDGETIIILKDKVRPCNAEARGVLPDELQVKEMGEETELDTEA